MTYENNENLDNNQSQNEDDDLSKTKADSELIERLAEEKANERLAKIKENLDKAYKKLADKEKAEAELKAKLQEATRQKYEQEGDTLKAKEIEIETLAAQNERLAKKLSEMERGQALDIALSKVEFLNEAARQTAYVHIVSELVQDDDGVWMHRSGASISDFIKIFVKDREFLLKPKHNTGAGTSRGGSQDQTVGAKPTGSVLKMSTTDLLELAKKVNATKERGLP